MLAFILLTLPFPFGDRSHINIILQITILATTKDVLHLALQFRLFAYLHFSIVNLLIPQELRSSLANSEISLTLKKRAGTKEANNVLRLTSKLIKTSGNSSFMSVFNSACFYH